MRMITMWSLLPLLLLAIAVQSITGQAPGDEDDDCLRDVPNEEVLMSSFNYRNLLRSNGGPWAALNNDNNNDGAPPFSTSTAWLGTSGTCARVVSVCGFSFGPQDNQLITQFINNTMRQDTLYIRVRFAINSLCTGGCLTTLDTFVLQTNVSDPQSINTVASNIFATQSVAVLTDPVRDGATIITRIIPIAANLSTTGLYVGFRDLGTCIGLSEVAVFYPVCDAISLDLGATFSETGFPGDTSSGMCFNNMAISINPLEDHVTATCMLTSTSAPSQQTDQIFTNWTINNNTSQQCMCRPGYEFTNRITTSQCQACEPFHFKNTLSNTDRCKPCPMFSNTGDDDVATIVCPCDQGYFRPLNGSEDAMRCTRPPSVPQNASVSNVNNTSAFIMWEAPEDDGNRTDLFYTISINPIDLILTTFSTSITLTGLIPFTQHEIRVTADNGVSSQDNNTDARTVAISIMTSGQAPSVRINPHNPVMEVGQPLALECLFTIARGINNPIDIVWSDINSGEVTRRSNVGVFTTNASFVIYRDYFNISQLTTDDNNVTYECRVMINALEYSHRLTLLLSVPIHSITISPNGQGAMVGNNHTFRCMIRTVSGVFLNSVMVTWIGPSGIPITNSNRIIVDPLTLNSDGSTVNITSSLQFLGLMREDEGIYVCDVVILQTSTSVETEIGGTSGAPNKSTSNWMTIGLFAGVILLAS